MFYSNMLSGVTRVSFRNDDKSFPLIIEGGDKVSKQTVRVFENDLYVTGEDKGENIFELRGNKDDIPTPFKNACDFTYGELADTEENPLVVVCTKGIRFYYDVPTYIQVLFVKDSMMLVMLVYGACEFEFDDGTFLPLQRCTDFDLGKKDICVTYDCKDLKSRVICNTPGGCDITYEMVCPVLFSAKKKRGVVSVRCIKDNAFVFNEERIQRVIEEEKAKAERELLRLEEKKKEAEERRIRAAEYMEKKAKEELERRRDELLEKRKRKVAALEEKKSVAREKNVSTKRNAGAEAFLAFINGE